MQQPQEVARLNAERQREAHERGIVLFTVIDPATDEIVRSGHCQRCDLQGQCEPGQIVQEGVQLRDGEYLVSFDATGLRYTEGRRAPKVSVEDVKSEARRRILSRYDEGKQLTIMRHGGEELTAMGSYIDAVIAASHVLEADPPADFADDRNWPAALAEPANPRPRREPAARPDR